MLRLVKIAFLVAAMIIAAADPADLHRESGRAVARVRINP